jgi:hypothetical protein
MKTPEALRALRAFSLLVISHQSSVISHQGALSTDD